MGTKRQAAENEDAVRPDTHTTAPPLLEVSGLVKRYSNNGPTILDCIDLHIASGEFVAIMGRSGSGKSTLLNLIGQMDAPDAGRITFAGHDFSVVNEEARTLFRREHLGFVFQAYNLLPTLTVRENIALPLQLNELAREPRISQLLVQLDLDAVSERYPDAISGGEQQRTAIARAVAHRPSLVIADEPTGNLDVDTAAAVMRLFEHAVRSTGAALLMATHSRTMARHADRALHLERGRLRPADE